ncbi:MAG: glycoside hydrolase family 3 C-terminal domain-containing protein [Chitinispirillaceae bacterium]|nr:glycoside hydrolase family 3 C-terminal domain-containing protein [Chitinispirillaceae bacterium]
MNKLLTILGTTLLCAVPLSATRITNVNVDFLKGFAKETTEAGDTVFHYMGRATYNLYADGNDEISLDFNIYNKTTGDKLVCSEKSGDIGSVMQRNAGDTLKTVFFRTQVAGSTAGEYVGKIEATAGKNAMWTLTETLVAKMTLEQKQKSLYCSTTDLVYKNFGQDDITLSDGTKIVGWRSADGPHGIRYPLGAPNDIAIYGAGDTVTLFPTESALGCSWDIDLTYRVGRAIAEEGRAKGIYCDLGPMCDLVVNPRWGRAFETMGEDPYHVGMMTSRQVLGLQSRKVIACPKHFTPYVTETDRHTVRIVVEERALRELFCEPFRMCIQDAGARAIMTCYNKVKVPGFTIDDRDLISKICDKAGTNRHLIHDILRHDWGFNGIVMTDWQGTMGVDDIYSYETDYDMSMPDGEGGFSLITDYMNAGFFTEDPLNRKAKHVMYNKLWAWDGTLLASDDDIKTFPESVILSDDHTGLALEAAQKSITLVRNEPVGDAPILPLDKNATMTVAVVGPYAATGRPGGGGSSAVTADKIISPLEGIQAIAAQHPNITVTTDYNNADVAIVCVGVYSESEDYDRPSMELPDKPIPQNNLVATVLSKVPKTIVVYTGGSASSAGSWSEAPGVLIAFYPGRSQGQAIAEVLFGDINPSGHLNVTFPKTPADLPSYEHVDSELKLQSADTAHGYFYFEKTGKQPLFWFGHGLSYTTFSYDAIQCIGSSSIAAGDRLDVRVTVTNTGTRDGDEVVQLYVRPKSSPVARRVKDLRGFARLSLAAKETKTASFLLGPRDFSVYVADATTKTGSWQVVAGEYDIIAGSTSDPAVLTGTGGGSVITTVTIQ